MGVGHRDKNTRPPPAEPEQKQGEGRGEEGKSGGARGKEFQRKETERGRRD